MASTKKSLLASGLSLAVSAALLVGTTFAWFTDSVVNKGNTIQAGDLKVAFQYKDLDDPNAVYAAVPEEAGNALFNEIKWEPGRSYGYDFKVINDGSLAFDWELSFQNIKCEGGTNGAEIADVIDVYTTDVDAVNLTSATYVGTLSGLTKGAVKSDKLVSGETEFSVVLKMQDTAGNDYQNADVSFDMYLRAKQAMSESDGFGSTEYDKGAVYEQVNVSADGTAEENGEALQEAITNAKPGATIFVGAGQYDVTTKAHNLLINNDNVTIVGEEGTEISSKYTSGVGDCQQTIMIKGDNVTLKNLTINPVEDYANKTLEIMDAKNTVIENCTINATGAAVYIGGKNTANYVIRNNVINGATSAICIANGAGGVDNIDGSGIISGNEIKGNITLNGLGEKDSSYAWMQYDLKYLPEITDNDFTAPTVLSGMEYYLRSLSYKVSGTTDKPVSGMGPMGMVSQEYVTAFAENNTISGNDGYTYDYYSSNNNFAYYGKVVE